MNAFIFTYTETADRKDTVGLHVTMNDVLCMQIAKGEKRKLDDISVLFKFSLSEKLFRTILQDLLHALSCLPCNVYELDYLEVCLQDVKMFVEAAALTPLGHYGQVVLRHVAHEQQDVDMSCFPATSGRAEEEITKTKIRFPMKMILQEFSNLQLS